MRADVLAFGSIVAVAPVVLSVWSGSTSVRSQESGCGCGTESLQMVGRPEPTEVAWLPSASKAAPLPTVRVPLFGSRPIPFEETAIHWFGRLSERSNHCDVRVGANDEELFVYLAIFDRRLWFDERPEPRRLRDWDAATLYLSTDGSGRMGQSCYRITAQLFGEPSPERVATDRADPRGAWKPAKLPIRCVPGWRGNALNDDTEPDRGWAMGFSIPFRSLGLSGPPAEGAAWRIAVTLHDRDSLAGPPEPKQHWPSGLREQRPATWANLVFGLPRYASLAKPLGTAVIQRPSQDSPLVPDADVGGTSSNQCPGDEFHIWNEWANRNWGRSPDFNIQNQSDVADWPCFSRYYVTFPLDAVPKGKDIVSARLVLHQFGNAGGSAAQPSWIQVLIAASDWSERTITWNNAPPALENVGGAWVTPLLDQPDWPGVARIWDVSYAAAKAYARREPLRLILYEADSAYHSGKYFVSCDTGDWNAAGRPRLEVVWGERPTR